MLEKKYKTSELVVASIVIYNSDKKIDGEWHPMGKTFLEYAIFKKKEFGFRIKNYYHITSGEYYKSIDSITSWDNLPQVCVGHKIEAPLCFYMTKFKESYTKKEIKVIEDALNEKLGTKTLSDEIEK